MTINAQQSIPSDYALYENFLTSGDCPAETTTAATATAATAQEVFAETVSNPSRTPFMKKTFMEQVSEKHNDLLNQKANIDTPPLSLAEKVKEAFSNTFSKLQDVIEENPGRFNKALRGTSALAAIAIAGKALQSAGKVFNHLTGKAPTSKKALALNFTATVLGATTSAYLGFRALDGFSMNLDKGTLLQENFAKDYTAASNKFYAAKDYTAAFATTQKTNFCETRADSYFCKG
jgi:hypothetical protein